MRNAGNIALLQMAGDLKLIDAALAREVADAYRTFRSIQHRLRLNGAQRARVARAEVEREAAVVTRLWNSVFTPSPAAAAINVKISIPIAIAAIMLRVVNVMTAAARPATSFGLVIDRSNAPCVRKVPA